VNGSLGVGDLNPRVAQRLVDSVVEVAFQNAGACGVLTRPDAQDEFERAIAEPLK
jgi:hypothetical protein